MFVSENIIRFQCNICKFQCFIIILLWAVNYGIYWGEPHNKHEGWTGWGNNAWSHRGTIATNEVMSLDHDADKLYIMYICMKHAYKKITYIIEATCLFE